MTKQQSHSVFWHECRFESLQGAPELLPSIAFDPCTQQTEVLEGQVLQYSTSYASIVDEGN